MDDLEQLRSRVKTVNEDIPTTYVPEDMFPTPMYKLLAICGLCKSYGEAKRLIAGGGVRIYYDTIVHIDNT